MFKKGIFIKSLLLTIALLFILFPIIGENKETKVQAKIKKENIQAKVVRVDLNQDSDEDGILDNLDSHPAGGGRNIAQYFEWVYADHIFILKTQIHSDWYDFYREATRQPHGAEYVTYDDPTIIDLAKKLLAKAEKYNLNCPACFVVAFTQGLPYVEDDYIGDDDYPKYPLETLLERNGDCEDVSYLAAAILRAMGRDVVLVKFDNHIGIAIWGSQGLPGTYYQIADRRYYYNELTEPGWTFGQVPDIYQNVSYSLIEIP